MKAWVARLKASEFWCCWVHSWRHWRIHLTGYGHGWEERCEICDRRIASGRNYT